MPSADFDREVPNSFVADAWELALPAAGLLQPGPQRAFQE
jgi:hypothetical protein